MGTALRKLRARPTAQSLGHVRVGTRLGLGGPGSEATLAEPCDDLDILGQETVSTVSTWRDRGQDQEKRQGGAREERQGGWC